MVGVDLADQLVLVFLLPKLQMVVVVVVVAVVVIVVVGWLVGWLVDRIHGWR